MVSSGLAQKSSAEKPTTIQPNLPYGLTLGSRQYPRIARRLANVPIERATLSVDLLLFQLLPPLRGFVRLPVAS